MIERQHIPSNLAEIPPGPQLAAVLAEIDSARLSGFDCVEVMKAHYRLLNHDRAQLMASMVEVGLAGDGEELTRRDTPDEFAADEVRAALVWTRRAAENQFGVACGLKIRLPAVLAAMDSGRLDEPRARILFEWTTDLTQEQARTICDRLLPRVRELTTGQLIEQIKKLAIAIDPEWARRRYKEAVAERKVVGSRNPDGSANLSGLNLPVDRVADASARIEALARAAKRVGHPEPVDHVRADLYLGMIDGTYTGLDDDAIIGRLLADRPAAEPHGDDIVQDHSRSDDGQDGDASQAADHTGDADDTGSGSPAASPAAGAPAHDPCPADGEASRSGPGGASLGDLPACRRGGMELRVRLSTLLGRDRHPGELAGWGPVHAELARDLAASMTGAEWRYVFTDVDGRLEHAGLIRSLRARARPSRSGHVVELQVTAESLTELSHDHAQATGWAWLLADLARQQPDRDFEPGRFASDVNRRTPSAALRRYLQARDRYCVGPGCRAPARSGDIDHTDDYARGGRTLEDNLDSTCRHDHRLKHEGGWQLSQPEAGQFLWISRLGHAYHVRPPPIVEALPDPMPGDRPTPPHHPETVDHDDPVIPPPEARQPPEPPAPPPEAAYEPPPF